MVIFWWGSRDRGSDRCLSCHVEPWRERKHFPCISCLLIFSPALPATASETQRRSQAPASRQLKQPSGGTQGKSHVGGGQGAPANRMRLIWEQHAGRMTSAREGASLGPITARPSLPAEQSPEGLHGHIGPTPGQKPEKPQQELSQPAGREPEPHGTDQSSPSAWAGLPGGFGQVLPAATCSFFFLSPTGDSLGARVAALRKQLSLLLAPSHLQ